MKQQARPWNSPLVVFVVVFCLVLTTGTLVARELNANVRRAPLPSKLPFVKDWHGLAAVGHTRGSSSAPIQVVVFADYQCPGCAALHQLLAVAADSLSQQLQIVTRHFPLAGHVFARAAANAAECAAGQGAFAAFEDAAYQHQDSLGLAPWQTFATRAGVPDTVAFNRCVSVEQYLAVVERDRSAAQSLKFAGTPVYIVNGQPYFGAPPLRDLMMQLKDGASHVR